MRHGRHASEAGEELLAEYDGGATGVQRKFISERTAIHDGRGASLPLAEIPEKFRTSACRYCFVGIGKEAENGSEAVAALYPE